MPAALLFSRRKAPLERDDRRKFCHRRVVPARRRDTALRSAQIPAMMTAGACAIISP
jgi:hypothetical protein